MPDPCFSGSEPARLIILQSVDSTNNYALQRIDEGKANHGDAVFAYEQFAGKGQRGKSWYSEPGSNLILSLVLKPPSVRVSDQFYLSALIALSVSDFFLKYSGDPVKIKWPNDIYWQDRKAGGILIETRILGKETKTEKKISLPKINWVVTGIGLNINQVRFDPMLPNPVSLRQITGKQYDVLQLATELSIKTRAAIENLKEEDFEEILSNYNSRLYKKDQSVKFRKDSRVFSGTVKTVTPDGKLLIEHAFEEEFALHEIEWIVNS